MKAILMSIKHPYTDYINKGIKTSELRTRVPKLEPPFKVYTYETSSTGCGKIVNEWICKNITEWRMCVGIPAHLVTRGCVSANDIWKYCNKGYKNIFEMEISNLKVYDKPKELSEFVVPATFEDNDYGLVDENNNFTYWKRVQRAPQSWCYVEGESK